MLFWYLQLVHTNSDKAWHETRLILLIRSSAGITWDTVAATKIISAAMSGYTVTLQVSQVCFILRVTGILVNRNPVALVPVACFDVGLKC